MLHRKRVPVTSEESFKGPPYAGHEHAGAVRQVVCGVYYLLRSGAPPPPPHKPTRLEDMRCERTLFSWHPDAMQLSLNKRSLNLCPIPEWRPQMKKDTSRLPDHAKSRTSMQPRPTVVTTNQPPSINRNNRQFNQNLPSSAGGP